MPTDSTPEASLKVWDPIVRLGHWVLVVGFVVAYLSGEESEDLHVWSGYVVGAVVLIRLLWGLIGTRHARFSDFLYGPGQAIRYLIDLLRGSARRYVGHSPAGAMMVFMLLASLLATCGSGLVLYAIEDNAGPLAGYVDAGSVSTLSPIASAYADDDEDEDDEHEGSGEDAAEEFWEETHEFFANLALLLVLLHIGGVALASFAHKENLVRAMVNGRKRPPAAGNE